MLSMLISLYTTFIAFFINGIPLMNISNKNQHRKLQNSCTDSTCHCKCYKTTDAYKINHWLIPYQIQQFKINDLVNKCNEFPCTTLVNVCNDLQHAWNLATSVTNSLRKTENTTKLKFLFCCFCFDLSMFIDTKGQHLIKLVFCLVYWIWNVEFVVLFCFLFASFSIVQGSFCDIFNCIRIPKWYFKHLNISQRLNVKTLKWM